MFTRLSGADDCELGGGAAFAVDVQNARSSAQQVRPRRNLSIFFSFATKVGRIDGGRKRGNEAILLVLKGPLHTYTALSAAGSVASLALQALGLCESDTRRAVEIERSSYSRYSIYPLSVAAYILTKRVGRMRHCWELGLLAAVGVKNHYAYCDRKRPN